MADGPFLGGSGRRQHGDGDVGAGRTVIALGADGACPTLYGRLQQLVTASSGHNKPHGMSSILVGIAYLSGQRFA